MEEETAEQRVLCANEQGGPLPFWLHMANITTAYSRLLLLSRHPLADQNLQDPKSRSNMIDSATSILESYNDLLDSFSHAKYAPGCFFAYGLLAAAVIYKLNDNAEFDAPQARATALTEQFSNNLRLSPTVTRTEIDKGIFIQALNYIQRNESNLVGGMSGSLSSQGPIVPMLTTIFPRWWRLYL
ncbi:hypothetical protein FRC11_004520 [Ceratobasidium sp. 423]|nr:hypothetical protein FRC11_004520 [Ceratobasidium sp. 423]